MAQLVLDVVFLPSPRVSREAVAQSRRLADQMARDGNPSHFRLGEPLGGSARVCIPHVSLFMLAVDDGEVPLVNAALRRLAARLPPVAAVGTDYRHNPHGAPELYFEKKPAWDSVSRAVVAAVEPLRRGRLREFGPEGDRLHEVVGQGSRTSPASPASPTSPTSPISPTDADRVRQLLAYGYDEVVDDASDRFNPHVTLAWPERRQPRVSLADLPPASVFSQAFDRLAVCEMGPWGTCVRTHGTFRLAPAPWRPAPIPQPSSRPNVTPATRR